MQNSKTNGNCIKPPRPKHFETRLNTINTTVKVTINVGPCGPSDKQDDYPWMENNRKCGGEFQFTTPFANEDDNLTWVACHSTHDNLLIFFKEAIIEDFHRWVHHPSINSYLPFGYFCISYDGSYDNSIFERNLGTLSLSDRMGIIDSIECKPVHKDNEKITY